MSPGAKALKTLRASNITAVECKLTKSGKLRHTATIKVGDRTITTRQGKFSTSEILEPPGMPDGANMSRAAGLEMERLQREHTALLEANLTYVEHTARQNLARKLRARNRRAFDLAWFAVLDGVPLEELLKLVEKQWLHHSASEVMNS